MAIKNQVTYMLISQCEIIFLTPQGQNSQRQYEVFHYSNVFLLSSLQQIVANIFVPIIKFGE